MNSINVDIPIKITILSPTHIGSGKTAVAGLETLREETEITFISLNRLLEKVANNKRQLYRVSEIISGSSREQIRNVINPTALHEVEMYTIPDKTTSYSSEIHTFVKDARNIPLLPGTTLKGALRTLIYRTYINEHPGALNFGMLMNDKRFKPEQNVFGKDAQKDPMKILKVEDIYFNAKNLSVHTAKMFDISNNGSSCGFKKSGRNSELTTIERATPINVEAISKGTTLHSTISLDTYFKNKLSEILTSGKRNNVPIDANWFKGMFDNFFDTLSASSKHNIPNDLQEEINFLEKYGSSCNMHKIVEFYEELAKEIKNSSEAIYLCLAWGIGWKGITGNVFSEEESKKIARRFGLDKKRTAVVFPKTRRFFTQREGANEYISLPAGWIKIERGGK